jgi:hypothetical protein
MSSTNTGKESDETRFITVLSAGGLAGWTQLNSHIENNPVMTNARARDVLSFDLMVESLAFLKKILATNLHESIRMS